MQQASDTEEVLLNPITGTLIVGLSGGCTTELFLNSLVQSNHNNLSKGSGTFSLHLFQGFDLSTIFTDSSSLMFSVTDLLGVNPPTPAHFNHKPDHHVPHTGVI